MSFVHILQPLSIKCLPYALAILLALAGTAAAEESSFTGNTCYEEGANCQTEADWQRGWCEAAVTAGVFIGTADQCVQPGGGGGYLAQSRQNENAEQNRNQDGGGGDIFGGSGHSAHGVHNPSGDVDASRWAWTSSGDNGVDDYDPAAEKWPRGGYMTEDDIRYAFENDLIETIPLTEEEIDEIGCLSVIHC